MQRNRIMINLSFSIRCYITASIHNCFDDKSPNLRIEKFITLKK